VIAAQVIVTSLRHFDVVEYQLLCTLEQQALVIAPVALALASLLHFVTVTMAGLLRKNHLASLDLSDLAAN